LEIRVRYCSKCISEVLEKVEVELEAGVEEEVVTVLETEGSSTRTAAITELDSIWDEGELEASGAVTDDAWVMTAEGISCDVDVVCK
jgi:hypothetical protein